MDELMEQLDQSDQQRKDLKQQIKLALENKENEKKLKDLNRQLEFQVDELMEQLENADKTRVDLKKQLKAAQDIA